METLALLPNGDLDVSGGSTHRISGAEATRQRAECELAFFLGEWFLDVRKGVPYYRDVLVKNPDLEVVRSVLRRVLLEVPGIVSVSRLDVAPPAGNRRAAIDWEAQHSDGTTIGS